MSPKLAQRLVEPDFWTCPHGTRTRPLPIETYGPEVADICAAANFAPDPQQELGLDLIFAINSDGSPASFTFCVICCRQNLKTGLFKQAALGWLFVTDQQLVVWSAHEMSTTNEAQRELGDLMLESPALRRRMMKNENDGIYYANGSERIELANGQRIMFKARTKDGGRGLAAPKIILDEAFALKASMLGSLLPLVTAQKDPQILYGSSAGKADSDALRDIRDRGRAGASPRMSYVEWLSERTECADPFCRHPKYGVEGCALDRDDLILAANPTITTGRINLSTIHDLRQELPPEEFMRECLGWWDEAESGNSVITSNDWSALDITLREPPVDPPTEAPARYALAMSPERIASIAVAIPGDDIDFLDLAEMDRVDDSRKVIEWLVQRCGRRVPVMIDSRDPAAAFINELRTRHVKVNATTQADSGKACMGLLTAVEESRIEHVGQPTIDTALKIARKKPIGKAGLWEWDLEDPTAEMAALRAMTLAHYGLSLKKSTPGGPKKSKVVVMA